jgi:hypothetical protein
MKKWKTNKTLLIVGEGYDELAFLNHIKQFPGVCGQGVQITIKNARGKGALGVIEWTRRQTLNTAYDHVAAMIDTDTDWTPEAAKLAKANKIQVIASDPCLEALLLRLIGKKPGEAKSLKSQFAPFVNGDATLRESYVTHFGLAVLLRGRDKEAAIDELLKLIKL